MSFLRKTYHEAQKVIRFLQRIHSTRVHINRDIKKQKQALIEYTSNIDTVEQLSQVRRGVFAIFVLYAPDGSVSKSNTRILQALKNADVQVFLASNHALSAEQKEAFSPFCHTLIARGNQGHDFGAYKDVVAHLKAQDLDIERLIFMNDSVFYAQRGLDDFVAAMLGAQDVISAFENWGDGRHFQSFAISVSAAVWNSRELAIFWETYIPVSNRIHAIEEGEKKLSKAILAVAKNYLVIYSISGLYAKMEGQGVDASLTSLLLPRPWNPVMEEKYRALPGPDAPVSKTAHAICEIVNETSPIHAGVYYFSRYLNCPLFKKDIVFRQRFQFWEVENWTMEIMEANIRDEFLHVLRTKGDAESLGRLDRRKYDVGVM